MSLHRFFLSDQIIANEDPSGFVLGLSESDLHHACVLRIREGEHIAVIDAASDYFECEVLTLTDAGMKVKVCTRLGSAKESYSITLFQGLAKGDRFEEVIRHATEVGCTAFVPLKCARSVVKLDAKKARQKQERWQTIAKSASEQSGRASIPVVEEVIDVDEAVVRLHDFDVVLICWEEADISYSIRDALESAVSKDDVNVAIIIGPEGGLEDAEVNRLLSSNDNAVLVSLGPTILRTETAGVVSVALVSEEIRYAQKPKSIPHENGAFF